jgi:DNA-binding transcriptional ArsR family regulator
LTRDESSNIFDVTEAELFEALGHPTRITILELLNKEPMSFSALKNVLGIESSGHLSFHLGKLSRLVKTDADGRYGLTDLGREAVRVAKAVGEASSPTRPDRERTRQWITWRSILVILLVVFGITLIPCGTYLSVQTTPGPWGEGGVDLPPNLTISSRGNAWIWNVGEPYNPYSEIWRVNVHWQADGDLVLVVNDMSVTHDSLLLSKDVLVSSQYTNFVDASFTLPPENNRTLTFKLVNNSEKTVHVSYGSIWFSTSVRRYEALGTTLVYLGGAIVIIDGGLLAWRREKARYETLIDRISGILSEVRTEIQRMRIQLAIAALVYMVSLIFGWYIASSQSLTALDLRVVFAGAFGGLSAPFGAIANAINRSILLLFHLAELTTLPIGTYQIVKGVPYFEVMAITVAVIYAVYLCRIFVTTTLPGAVPLVGAIIVGIVGMLDGVAYGVQAAMLGETYLQPFIFPPFPSVVLSLQILTYLIAEIMTTAAGINIALAPLHTEKYGTASKWSSLKMAWKEAALFYVVVIILLAVAAVFEIISLVP